MQVRSLAELLPSIDVVADDPFNSSPTDASLMGQDVLARGRAGEDLPVTQAPTPLVGPPHPPSCCWDLTHLSRIHHECISQSVMHVQVMFVTLVCWGRCIE